MTRAWIDDEGVDDEGVDDGDMDDACVEDEDVDGEGDDDEGVDDDGDGDEGVADEGVDDDDGDEGVDDKGDDEGVDDEGVDDEGVDDEGVDAGTEDEDVDEGVDGDGVDGEKRHKIYKQMKPPSPRSRARLEVGERVPWVRGTRCGPVCKTTLVRLATGRVVGCGVRDCNDPYVLNLLHRSFRLSVLRHVRGRHPAAPRGVSARVT